MSIDCSNIQEVSKSHELAHFFNKRSFSYAKFCLFSYKGWWHLMEADNKQTHENYVVLAYA